MPPESPDTPSTGIDINTAASQLEALLDAENGQAQDDDDREDSAETGEEGDPGDEADETAAEDSEDDVEVDDEAAEDDEQPEPKAEEEFEVDLGRGEKVKVTRDELIKGYLRQSDYTRKTQEVAEGRKRLEGEASEVLRERAQYAALLPKLEEQIRLVEAMPEPDWDALYAQSPIEAARLERKYRVDKEQRDAKLSAIQAEKARVAEADQRQNAQQFMAYVAEQQEVLVNELLPAWRDPKVARREKAELVEYALKAGLTAEEVRTLADARAVALLHKAMRFDRAMARKQAGAQGAQQTASSPTLKPGNASAKPSVKVEVKKQYDRLKRTGSVQDAAKLFESML